MNGIRCLSIFIPTCDSIEINNNLVSTIRDVYKNEGLFMMIYWSNIETSKKTMIHSVNYKNDIRINYLEQKMKDYLKRTSRLKCRMIVGAGTFS